jgi:hypothetical protein
MRRPPPFHAGRYAKRAGPALARILGTTPNTTEVQGPPELNTPGWKTLHIVQFGGCVRLVAGRLAGRLAGWLGKMGSAWRPQKGEAQMWTRLSTNA